MMSAQTIRKALGLLQDDPDNEDAWGELRDALGFVSDHEPASPPDLDSTREELFDLLGAALRAHEMRREHDAVAEILRLEAALARGTDREAEFVAELARVYDEELLSEDAATRAFARLAEIAPGSTPAEEVLEKAQVKREKWRDLVARYVQEAKSAGDSSFKSSLLVRAAETSYRYGRLEAQAQAHADQGPESRSGKKKKKKERSEPEKTNGGSHAHPLLDQIVTGLSEALQLDPRNRRAAMLLERVYREEGRFEDVASALESFATEAPAKDDKVAGYLRLARVLKKKLKADERAVSVYERILDLAPGNQEATAALVEYFSAHDMWDHLVALYEEQLAGGGVRPGQEAGVILQIAMVHWRMRGRPEAAEPYFERLRRSEPAHPGMLEFFREACKKRGDMQKLAAVLADAQRSLPDGSDKARLGAEVAQLAEEGANAQKAIEQWRTVLRQDPNSKDARDALKRLYRATGGFNALADLLRSELERVAPDDAAARLPILRDIAALYRDHIKSDSALVTVLSQITALDPNDAGAVRELVRVYDSLGRWRDLLTAQLKLAELEMDAATKAGLYRQVARRWLDQFSNVQNAVEAYEKLREVAPDDAEATEKLKELYGKRRAFKPLYDLLESEVSRMPSGEQRRVTWIEMAKIAAERLEKGADAVRLYKQVLEEDPQAAGALDALEKQAERDKDFVTVAEVLEKRSTFAPDDATRLTLLQKLGAVYSERLRDAQGAMRTWKRVLELSPGHQKALRVLRESYVAVGDYDGLTELYSSQRDYEGLVEVLSSAADKAQDPEHKIALSYRAADVFEQNLNQPDRAFRSYERVLSVRGNDERAAQRLVPIYEAEEKWARLPPLYDVLLQHAKTDEERVALLKKLVAVYSDKLSDKVAAFSFARKAYALDPGRPGALTDLEGQARASGDFIGFCETLANRANDEATSANERRSLGIKLAQTYARELGRVDEAATIYKQLIAADPTEEEAMILLDGLLRAHDRRDDLRWLFRLRTERAKTAQKLEILGEWAVLEEEVLGSQESAVSLYREMLSLVPHHGPALRALSRLLRAAGDAEGAAKILEQDRDLREGVDKIAREIELARLYITSLRKPNDALAAVKRVFEVSPNEPDAIAVTEELLNVGETRARAAVILEATYARIGNYARQADVLGVLIATAASKTDRLDLQLRLAEVHENLGAHAHAFDVLIRASDDLPGEIPLWDKLSVLASRTHRTQEFVEALARAVPAGGTTELPAAVEMDLSERAATIFEDGLGDIDRALPYWERIFQHDPQNERAFIHLKNILTTREKWAELESLYERACAATSDVPRKTELLNEAALVAEELRGDRVRAIEYYERILEISPEHQQASFALDKLYEQTERWDGLAKLLAKRLPNLSGEEATELKVRLGAIHFNKLGQPREALGYLEEVLVAEPATRDAQLIVERCLDVAELRARAAQVLEGVYNERGESRELVRILEIRLEFAADAIERRELLRRVAELRDEKLTDDPSAFDAYARLLPLAPQDNVARERLLEIAKRLGRQERAAEVLSQAADAADAPQPRAEILADVAKLYEGMGDNGRAETVYRRVLELDPEDAGLALPAARALERVYTASGKNAELADVFRIQVKLEENVDERRRILGRLGELCEKLLGDAPRAIEAWKMRLEDDPGDEAALAALDRLYEATGNHRALVETLRARERGAQAPEARRELMTRIATTLADKLGDTDEAILAYRAVLDDFGAELTVLRALERLYEAASRFGDLAETLEAQLSLVQNPSEQIGIFARLGDVKRTRLEDTPGALEAFRQALSIDASHLPSREALERILDDEDCRRDAASILQPLYEAEGLDAPLLRVIDIEVEYAESVDDRLRLLAQAATVSEGRLSDAPRAFAYAAKGLRQAADGPQLSSWLERAERLAVVSRAENEHIALLAEVAPNILDEDAQLGVLLRIAELARVRKNDPQMAIDYYKKALDLRADNARALSALEELYGQANQAEDLRDILRRRSDAAANDADKKSILFKEARLVDEVQGNKRDAISIYEQILEMGLDRDALSALERLYTAEGRWDDLVALYERELTGTGVSAVRKAELHQKLGTIFAEKLSEVERAFDEYEAALKIDSQHTETIERLEALMRDKAHANRAAQMLEGVYLVRLDWRKVMRTIEARLEVSQDPDDKRELLRRLAKLHEEQEENYRAALEVMAKLLTEDVTDETTWSELERLARVANAEARLAEIYAGELEKISADEPSTARLSFRTGELFEAQKQSERALTFYKRAYAFAPDESPQAFTAIDRLLKSENKPKDRIQLYREALDHKHEPADRIATLHTIAGLEENDLNDADAAILTLRQAVDVDDSDARALDALTRLYEKQERWADLADLFRRRAEQSAMPDDEAKFRLALGKVQKDKLGQTESAIDEYQIIVDLDAPAAIKQAAVRELEALVANERHRPRIVDILRPIYEKADDWKNLVRVNGERLAISTDPREQATILRETAQLWETRGGDQWRAFIATKQAFVLDPEDFGTRQELDRLAELTSLWDELAESYEKALEKIEDHGKRELLEALAKLHDKRRDDPRKALDAYDRLFKLDETDPTPLDEMDQLATLLSDWPTLVRVLVKKAELAGNDEDRASTWRRIGEARRDMLDDAQGAIEAYERALELEPDSTFSLDCLIMLYEDKNDAARLVDLYKRRVELATEDDDDLKFRLLCDAADRYEVGLSDRREAISLLEQAAALRPADVSVVTRLGRLFAAEKMWPELLANLRKSVELASVDTEKRDLKRRIGDLLKKELEDPENALEAYREVLAGGFDAHSVAEVREIGETRDELRGNAARILLPVLRSAGENAAYADALEMLVRAQTEPDERAQTLRTLAEVCEKDLGDVARSENALLRALAEVPHDESLHQMIERVCETTGREGWSRYADAIAEKAAAIFDAEVTSNLWKKVGRVASKRLADIPRAAEAFQKAAEQSGDNAEVLGLLEEAFAALGDTPALVDVLERRISITDDAATQADLHHRLAVLALEKTGDKVRGLAALRTALERVPDHGPSQRTLEGLLDDSDLFPDVAETLEQVYRTLGNATALASIYERKVGRAQGQKERVLARMQLAKVLENDARDSKAAQRAIEAALSENPTDLDVMGELERLAAQNGEFAQASDVLQRALETFDSAPGTLSTPNLAQLAEGGSAKLWVRLAEWRRDRLSDARGAEEALLKGLKADSEDLEIVKAIEALRRAPGRERDLVETLRTRAKLETELSDKRALYKEARELADAPIADAKLAEEVLRDLLAEDEADAWGLAELTELRRRAGDWNEVVALLLKRADAGQDGAEIVRLKHEAAGVLTKELARPDKAIDLYKDLLDQDASDTQASEQLRALYESTAKFQELGKLLTKLIENAQSPEERAKLRLELSRLQSDKFDSPADAIDTLRATLEENPDESHAIVRLSELLEKTGQDAELADFLNTQIARARDRQDVEGELAMMVRLGEVLEHRVKDAGRALKAYEDVLEREPGHRGALEAVARLAESRDSWDRVSGALDKLLAMTNDESGVSIALRLANAKEKLGDVDGVEQALGRALELDARNASVRDRLRALYEKRKKWAELAAMLVGDAELVRAKTGSVPPPAAAASSSLAPPPPAGVAEEVKLLRQAATIHMKERGAPADAVPLLERATERVPQDRELLLVLCDAYTASSRARDAANVLERIIASFGTKRTKELALYHHRLGRALIGLGEKEQALAQLDLAFKIDPGSVEVLRDLGVLSLETGDLDRAQKTFRALLLQKLDPASGISKGEVFLRLGEISMKQGDKPKAVQMLERAIENDPQLTQAKTMLAELKK
jgi:tetratricopeptide (TPR) repeat protein